MTTSEIAVATNRFPRNFFTSRTPEYFEATFVRTSDIDELKSAIRPEGRNRRIVIVDGQARAGKTWSAVAAITEVLKENSDVCFWSAGEESCELFSSPDEGATVLDGIIKARDLFSRVGANLVLLDDIFGTFRLRELASDENGLEQLARLIDVTSDDHISNGLPQGGVLVLTSRSSLLTAIELILDCRIRPHNKQDESVLRFSRGLFRLRDGSVGGTYTPAELDKIYELNDTYEEDGYRSTLRPRYPELTTFSKSAPEALAHHHGVSAVMFGADFDLMADLVRSLKESDPRDVVATKTLDGMCRAYAMEIAPGIVFLDPSGYRALGIHAADREQLADDLFLRPKELMTGRGVQYGRVPNEHYIWALQEHFEDPDNIDTAAFALRRTTQLSKHAVVALRGLLEQAIERLPMGSPLPKTLLSWRRQQQEVLFDWELDTDFTNKEGQGKLVLKPGFCAALGWAIYRTRRLQGIPGTHAVEWITRILSGFFTVSLRDKDGYTLSEAYSLPAAFSTLLHWAFQMEVSNAHQHSQKYPNLLSELVSIVRPEKSNTPRDPSESKDLARMVLDDELIWACTASINPLIEQTGYVKQLIETLSSEAEESLRPADENRFANRLFTFFWHNEWMLRPEEDPLHDRISKWLASHYEPTMKLIRRQPYALDLNLQYHWCHFMTERNVWMRDWCFSPNPDSEERKRNRPAAGSAESAHNAKFLMLISTVLDARDNGAAAADRLRNCIMLLGTRTARLPTPQDVPNMTNLPIVVDLLSRHSSDQTALPVQQAIFELARQGYLEEDCEHTSIQFKRWCKEQLTRYKATREMAWRAYLGELDKATYLDLTPEQWSDIKPLGWE